MYILIWRRNEIFPLHMNRSVWIISMSKYLHLHQFRIFSSIDSLQTWGGLILWAYFFSNPILFKSIFQKCRFWLWNERAELPAYSHSSADWNAAQHEPELIFCVILRSVRFILLLLNANAAYLFSIFIIRSAFSKCVASGHESSYDRQPIIQFI